MHYAVGYLYLFVVHICEMKVMIFVCEEQKKMQEGSIAAEHIRSITLELSPRNCMRIVIVEATIDSSLML